ncbi:hypothetical protein QYE88_42430, partial [Enterobacter hormaechei subsp. steigerwaltii]|nr:hypothetical protein [Enterobacter hormaechei subsp. steigerwaltii]
AAPRHPAIASRPRTELRTRSPIFTHLPRLSVRSAWCKVLRPDRAGAAGVYEKVTVRPYKKVF